MRLICLTFLAMWICQIPSSAQNRTNASAFSGTSWKNDIGDSRIRFEADGTWREDWGKVRFGGRWQATSSSEATVKRSDGKSLIFAISEEGKGLTRKAPPCHYNREKLGASSPLSTNTSLTRGPYNNTRDKKYKDAFGNEYWRDVQGRRRYD